MPDDIKGLSIGSDTFYPSYLADGIPFHFKAIQNQFLIAHQKTKNAEIAAQMVGKDADWAKKFLSSPKWRRFVASTMLAVSVRNGMTVEWWYQFAKWLTDGYKEHYTYQCEFCQFQANMNVYEAETYREDDLSLAAQCHACYKPVTLNYVKEPFKPSREAVEGWKEVGNRIIPKIERIQHEYSTEEFVFETQ